ncbi:MAG: alanine racemase [Candidatus Latescibacterota bacterium]|nr:alanine racemase [Candidatus Latescibacterota bacterium]
MTSDKLKSWCEIDEKALDSNVKSIRSLLAPTTKLGIVVKSNAYGHGLDLCAKIFERAAVDWLIVNSVQEATALRASGIKLPVYICVQVLPEEVDEAAASEARVVVCDKEVVSKLAVIGRAQNRPIPCHVKLETGTHRQGLDLESAVDMAKFIFNEPGLYLEGLTTHLADSEDTSNHGFTDGQHQRLEEVVEILRESGVTLPMVHSASSATTLLRKDLHGDIVRVGIAAYGLWPSSEVSSSFQKLSSVATKEKSLLPALKWKARISQIKEIDSGNSIGYGRTFVAKSRMRIGIIPVGYYEGYDRRLSNIGYVLIEGEKAQVCGRVCMNMFMVDLTNLPRVKVGCIATLLGAEDGANVSAEVWADWLGTINYEVVSRINPELPRLSLLLE